ncbi:hypothetical protein LEP1GSC150_2669 [Leptospira interrogans serovar Copenhageni str. LT2050]|uniref:Lipoprotein n=1 Tax=Leptospira interrogans serovar Copenhageni str. LT2050 TaxID=1001598 RepID=M3IP86_LEPIT|nr:hypothetical protein LEP1GSC150_2669 [Leptospira interrogans serovar Copenhageni str. LT2050]
MLNFRKIAYWVLFILSLFLFCIEKKSFRRLEKPGKDKGIVYVIRQIQPTLAVWSYDFRLEKYKSHFKKKGETQLISRFDLSNGEYFTEELEEGFYLLSIPSKIGVEKIFRIEKGKRIFLGLSFLMKKKYQFLIFLLKKLQR